MIDLSNTPTGTPPTETQKVQINETLGIFKLLADKQHKLVALDVDLALQLWVMTKKMHPGLCLTPRETVALTLFEVPRIVFSQS